MRLLAIILVVLLAASPVLAADPQRAERMIEVLRIQQTMAQMRNTVVANASKNILDECKRDQISDEQCRTNAATLMQPIERAMDEAMNWDAIKDDFIKIYASALSDREVDAAVAFYSSPEGQALLDKLPALTRAGSELGQKRMSDVMPRLQEELRAAAKTLKENAAAPPAAPVPPGNGH